MSSKYIIEFQANTSSEKQSVFLELGQNNYNGIDTYESLNYIAIRSHEDKSHFQNDSLFWKVITNKISSSIEFLDDDQLCRISYEKRKDLFNVATIYFDSNSKSAYNQFKTEFTELMNTDNETEYYKSGNMMYTGKVLYQDGERVPHNEGILYYDRLENNIKYIGEFENGKYDGSGIFYNLDGKLYITAKNISNGIPTQKGKLCVNYKEKDMIDIDFNDIWNKFDLSDKSDRYHFVNSNHFVENIFALFCSKYDLQKLKFLSKSKEQKLVELWTSINKIKHYQENNIQSIREEHNMIFRCLLFTFVANIFVQFYFFFLYKF